MLKRIITVIKEYRRQKNHWEDICDRCGMCCHEHGLDEEGEPFVNLMEACEFYDENTGLCTCYDTRFEKQPRCRKVTLRRALFDRSMPPGCAYVRHFRALIQKQEEPEDWDL